MAQETIEQTFSVSTPARLTLSNVRGSVTIRAAQDGEQAGNTVHVKAVKHLDNGDPDSTRLEITQPAGNTVSVLTRYNEGGWPFFSFLGSQRPCKVDYEVSVPHACSVGLECVSSSAALHGLDGEFQLKTVSGALTLQELSGRLQLKTVSGDITAEGLAGALSLDTVSGQAHFSRSNLPAIDVSSISGDVWAHTPLGDGPYRFKSVSGNVELRVPGDTRCTLEAHRISGRLATDLPGTGRSAAPGQETLDVQGGGQRVQLNTIAGDLRLLLAEGERAPQPAPSPGASGSRAVLERIERGELTVEEGLAELRRA